MSNIILKQGDCLELMKELPDESVDAVITDPPYGINYQSAWRPEAERFSVLQGDEKINPECVYTFYKLLKEESALYLQDGMYVKNGLMQLKEQDS